jgi:hypothetical protein
VSIKEKVKVLVKWNHKNVAHACRSQMLVKYVSIYCNSIQFTLSLSQSGWSESIELVFASLSIVFQRMCFYIESYGWTIRRTINWIRRTFYRNPYYRIPNREYASKKSDYWILSEPIGSFPVVFLIYIIFLWYTADHYDKLLIKSRNQLRDFPFEPMFVDD